MKPGWKFSLRRDMSGGRAAPAAPWRLALGRFRRHRLGMLGLLLVILISAAVLIVPLLAHSPPSETRPWIGAQAPLFTTPDTMAENGFARGQPPHTSHRPSRRRALRYRFVEKDSKNFRIVRRGAVITAIQKHTETLPELDLKAFAGPVYEVLADGRSGRTLARSVLRAGEPPPEGLFAPGERVLFLRAVLRETSRYADIDIEGAVVKRITVREPGEPPLELDRLLIRGAAVREVRDRHTGQALTLRYWFGSDDLGRDLMARVFAGGRISLLIGLVATLVSLVIGVVYGALAGYARERTDRLMMGVVDVLYAVPFLFLVIVLMVAFGRHLVLLFLALGAVQWLTMARIVRGQVRALKHLEFVEAARLGGAGTGRVIFRHLLPHTAGPVLVYTTLTVPIMIMEESFLAFIGLQAQYAGTTLDSWGALIHAGVQALGHAGEKSWLLLFPAVTMALMLFGLNALGDGLRDAFDPREGKG